MSKSKQPRPSTVILSEIESIPAEVRLAHLRHEAAWLRVADLHEILASQLVYPKGGEDMSNPRNHVAFVVSQASSDLGRELAAMNSIIGLLEASPQFGEAQKTLAPLLSEFEKARDFEQTELRQTLIAEQELRDRVEQAKAQAFSKIEAEFAVS